ncbi:hypothetical protein [Fulvivirga sp.]|uniref:hypothetical protein n=1 Tax=Fulvivirga sp. TaxID=1931237 RepID=UPI0032EF5F70
MKFIKILLIALICISTNYKIYAQSEHTRETLKPIFKIGYVNSTLYGTEVDLRIDGGSELINRHSYLLGLDLQINFLKILYVKPGLNLINIGGHLEGGRWAHRDPVKLTRLRIPLLFGLSTPEFEGFRVSFEAGIGLNLALSSDIDYSDDLDPSGGMRSIEQSPISKLYGINFSNSINKRLEISFNLTFFNDTDFFHNRKYVDGIDFSYELWSKGYQVSFGLTYKPE